jgi:aspartate carbamoyltransferase catalytic subunit
MTSDMVAAVPTPPGAGIFSTSGSTPGAAIAPGDLGMPGLAPPPAGPSADPRHFLGLEGLSRATLLTLLADAAREREWLKLGEPNRRDLAGVTVVLAFIEDSTRTRTSFEIAAQRLGANTVVVASAASSRNKGETMGAGLVVVRHPSSGAPAWLARQLATIGVLNAGDGMHEHPTQGLLDLLTLQDAWQGRFEGRRLAIVGDIAHSRVARSAIAGLTALGTSVTVCGPGTLLPVDVEQLGCDVSATLEDALDGADGVMALRLQRERMESGLLPAIPEYARLWGLTPERVSLLAPDGVVLHPGPVNRGVEMAHEVADGPRSRIFEQVANGVAVRCAVLRRCAQALRRPHGFTATVAAR